MHIVAADEEAALLLDPERRNARTGGALCPRRRGKDR
jgi:hypothetical protein